MKKYIIPIALVIIVGVFVKNKIKFNNEEDWLWYNLTTTSDEINKKCPENVDEFHELDSVSVSFDPTVFTYHTSLYGSKGDLLKEISFIEYKKVIRETRINALKKGLDLKKYYEHNVTFKYLFFDNKGDSITTLILEPKDYFEN